MIPRRQTSRRVILAAILMGTFASTLGNSVANVALPAVIADFQVPLSSGVWVVSLYTLFFAVLMPVGGYLGDRYGHRRMYLWGLGLYTLAVLASGIGPSFPSLLVSRALMGVGVAPTLPSVMAIIASMFGPGERGRAIGAWALANSAGHALGPLLSGTVTQHFGWRATFLASFPICAATLVLVILLVPRDRVQRSAQGFDLGGAAALTVAAFGIMLALTQSVRWGWTAPGSLALWMVALLALAAFVAVERRTTQPFVELGLFANRRYLAALAAIGAEIFCLFGLLLALPVFLIQVQGWDSQFAGLLVFPLPMTMAVVSPLAGRLADVRGSRWTCTLGMVLMGAAALAILCLRPGAESPVWWALVGCLVVMGLGMGLIQSPSTAASIQVVRPDQVGVASGVFHMGRFLSGSLGSTIFGLILQGSAAGLVVGFHSDLWLLVGVAVLTLFAVRGMPGLAGAAKKAVA